VYSLTSVTAGGCDGSASGHTTVTVIPPAPAGVNAFTLENRTVQVTWASVDHVDAYQIERRTQFGGSGTIVATTSALSFVDIVPESNQPVTYLYFVRAIAAGTTSDYGAPDYATCATALYQQPQITPAETTVLAVDLAELRSAIDGLRYAYHLPPGSYTPLVEVRAIHFTEIIAALSAVRPFVYSVPQPQAEGDVLAAHVQQIREALR
jgi:hypothetical protein